MELFLKFGGCFHSNFRFSLSGMAKSRWPEHNSGRMEHSGCAKSGGCLLHIAPTWPACNLLHTTAYLKTLQHTKSCFNMLQHTAAYCNTKEVLQDTAAYLSIPQLLHTSTCCSIFKHIAAQSNILQHLGQSAVFYNILPRHC